MGHSLHPHTVEFLRATAPAPNLYTLPVRMHGFPKDDTPMIKNAHVAYAADLDDAKKRLSELKLIYD